MLYLPSKKFFEDSYSEYILVFFFFSSRRRHTRFDCDWSSDVCSSDLGDRASEEFMLVLAAVPDVQFHKLRRAAGSRFSVAQASTWDDVLAGIRGRPDRKSTRLNSSHSQISYAVFCLKKKKRHTTTRRVPSCEHNRNQANHTTLTSIPYPLAALRDTPHLFHATVSLPTADQPLPLQHP